MVTAHQVAFLHHFLKIITSHIHGGPNGYHEFNPHAVQFIYHRFGVGEKALVKAPVPLFAPMEKVDDNHVDGQPPTLIFPCYRQDFLLGTVPQFALPESQPIFRHHRNFTGNIGILFFHHRRRIPSRNPVIDPAGGGGGPFCHVQPECDPSNSRVIPQKTIP